MILLAIIETGIIVWISLEKKDLAESNQKYINGKQQSESSAFLAQSENKKGELVFGNINIEKKVYEKTAGNKRQLVLNIGKSESIISEIELDNTEQDNYRHFYPIKFSPLGNYVVFGHSYGMAPGAEDVYSISTGKVAGLNLCNARGGELEFTPDEKYFYTQSQNGICSAADILVYNSSDFSKKFSLAEKNKQVPIYDESSNEDVSSISYDEGENFLRITLTKGDNTISKELKYYFKNGTLVTASDVGKPEIEL